MVKPKRAVGPQSPDPITTEVVGSSLLAAAEEMGEILVRASYSANIKERRDSSSAILDARGGTIAQASHVPLHMGSMLGLGQAIIQRYPESEIRPGDMFITNDPYSGGGTHLPDITVAAPFFAWGKLVAFAANVAHHAEVGGAPSQTLDIYTEGLRIPLVRLYQEGKFRQDIMDFILLNCRLPDEREADLRAQAASVETGLQRLEELVARYPEEVFFSCLRRLEEQAEAQAIQGIRSIPPGTYRFTDHMDTDGIGSEPVPISVALTVGNDKLSCDFAGSAPQVRGPINLPYYATMAAVYYTLKAVVDPTLPANTGFYRTVRVSAPKGTIVNCAPPAPCLFRSDTAQRVVEVVLGALAQAAPERVVAASNGAVSGVYFLGYREDGSYYAYIETLGGGMGASTYGDGADGVQVHTTNTSNLPVEALELEYPMMVEQYELASDSGGPGRRRGGLGIVRQYRVLTDDIRVRTKGDRNLIAPWGLQGGLSGGRCRVARNPGTPEEQELTPKEYDLLLKAGEIICFVTPGAGGYGAPSERALADTLRDVREGKLSPQVAADVYKLSPEQLKGVAS
ncbi:MAG: hydantoinase B/oxoprolinase family protein [Dehalococcoidia bacterium]|nr:hydantoinase B/oxoprolinase family protein [Dehalococcoidia bacterium]